MMSALRLCLVTILILGLGLFPGPGPIPQSAAQPELPNDGRLTSIVPPAVEAVTGQTARGLQVPPLAAPKARPSPVIPIQRQGSVRLLALLVDFSDNTATVTANLAAFDQLVFGAPVAGRGSTRDYFAAVSYGQVDLVTLNLPSTTGWQRLPQTYAYYVNNQYGWGSYPQNAGRMVEDLLPLVDPLVNFANYDNDGDGLVDTLLIIHAGPGAEFSLSTGDVWSHASSISLMGGAPGSYDGVTVDRYVTVPEGLDFLTPGLVTSTQTDMTIGVICHEVAHGLWGLPDLYDLDLSSNGIGQWGLMGYGNWNGPAKWDPYLGFAVTDGTSPALPSAWSRIVAGFDTYFPVLGPQEACLTAAETLPGAIYRFKTTALYSQEYFLAENRQQLAGGYDQFLPGSGLLIWHVDEAIWSIYGGPNNDAECRSLPSPHCWGTCSASHFLVALEQADRSDHLEYATNRGDGGDPFPGTSANTAWQPYGVNPVNPESGSWYDTTCATNSCLNVTNIYAQAPPSTNICMSIQQATCADTEGDLGDAPTSLNQSSQPMTAYYAVGPLPYVQANFPTIYWPPPNPAGPRHHFCQVDAWLGATVSGELNADIMPDQDGIANINPAFDQPDMDSISLGRGFDDGLPLPVPLAICAQVGLPYTVTVGAPVIINPMPRYANAWIDANRDGDWADTLTCPGGTPAPEWIMQDEVLSLGPGTHSIKSYPWLPPLSIVEDEPFETWLRISLAEMPAPAPYDGRGPVMGYDLGETEDYRLGLLPTLTQTATLSEPLRIGDSLTYTIGFDAQGDILAVGAVISDDLPPGLRYLSSDPPGSYDPVTREISWTVDLMPNQPASVKVVVQVAGTPGRVVTNTAYLLWGNSLWRRASVAVQVEAEPEDWHYFYLPVVLRNYP